MAVLQSILLQMKCMAMHALINTFYKIIILVIIKTHSAYYTVRHSLL